MKWYEAVNGLRLMWALVLISVIGSASFADETTAKRLAATKLIKTPFIQETLDERFSRKEIIENSKIPPNVTEAHVAAVWEITEAALGKVRPKIENAMIESASQTFSIEELDVLAAFYSNPAGISAHRKLGVYTSLANQLLITDLQRFKVELAKNLNEYIEEQ